MSKAIRKGGTALITGAGMGIGRAAAIRCARDGMRLVAVDVMADKLENLSAELASFTSANQFMTLTADIGVPEQVERMVTACTRQFGAPSFLMNNAVTRAGKGHDAPLDEWRTAMDVNFWAAVETCRLLVPQMKEKGGAIVNVGSKQGITNPPCHPIYNITKAALKTYTELLEHVLRTQDGSPVTAHLLIPGWATTGEAQHRPGAWLPDQVVDMMISGVDAGTFYILCPDDETTAEMDRQRILWGAGDIVENRPPLSRWHEDWKAIAKESGT